MTTIDPHETLGELVAEVPELARACAHLGLDYCCGGGRTLGAAGSAAGIDVADVDSQLAAESRVAATDDWSSLGAADLVDHVEVTHHGYLRRELPRLSDLMRRVVDVHGGRHRELNEVAATLRELRDDLEPHLLKEERILFPMVRALMASESAPELHCGSLRNPIGVMRVEHDRVGELLRRLRDLTGGFVVPDDACTSYRELHTGLAELEADTHLHVHKENNVLFPAVVAEESRRSAVG
ncbi:MAG: iron-sulfur cluster repair di-iron protein [Acidimicrobiales bacterium]